jgi:hypothetical protein
MPQIKKDLLDFLVAPALCRTRAPGGRDCITESHDRMSVTLGGRREYFSSKAINDACRPFPWRNEFPEVCESSPALKEQTLSRWRKALEHDKEKGVRR